MPHGHGHHHDDDEDEAGEWMQLLKPSELREVQDLDRARKEVERQIIHSNQAKLAGRSEAERNGRTPSTHRIAGAGVPSVLRDAMSQMYSQGVQVEHLASLLPRPGDGEKQKQLAWQRVVDATYRVLSSPWFGGVTILITAASVCLYLYETTLDHADNSTGGGGWFKTGHHYPDWFPVVEDCFLVFFGAELGLRAVLANHDRAFWASTESVVDLLSVLPSIFMVAFDLRLWGFLRFLRLFRWADLMVLTENGRTKRTNEWGDGKEGSSDRHTTGTTKWKGKPLAACLKLLAFVARYVLVYAGVVLLLDRTEGGIEDISETDPSEPMDFISSIYMASMMLSTVGEGGYGPVPVSPLARIGAAIAVLVFLPLAAVRVAEIVKHSGTSNRDVRSVALIPGARARHVVACGSVTAANLKARLQEIFHADHGKHNVRWVRVVVLSPEPPSIRIAALMKHPRYRGRVTYVQGSPLDDDSLRKAEVDDAAAVMVLANKAPRSSHAEDMNLSLQAISVMTRVELERRQGYGPKLLVEVVDPNAALHLQAAGISQVVSSAQVKLSVLAQSCLCPGWSAVVANLLESRAALPPQALAQGSWLAEYYVGAKKTFYSVEFSPAFVGVLFGDAAVHIFEYFELILVAVETKHAGAGDEEAVIVNPSGQYRIGKGDRGFVLAESQNDARVIWDYMAKDRKGDTVENIDPFGSRFKTPEEEEAMAMETLGTAGVAGMGPQAFVDSMMFSRTLLHCQKRLPSGEAPDIELILSWARQFQSSDGLTDDMVIRKILGSAGLSLPRGYAVSSTLNRGPAMSAMDAAAAQAEAVAAETAAARASLAAAAAARTSSAARDSANGRVHDEQNGRSSEDSAAGTTVTSPFYTHDGGEERDEDGRLVSLSSFEGEGGVEPSGMPPPPPPATVRDISSSSAAAAVRMGGGGANEDSGFTGEEILSALRTMEVSTLNGEEACRRLLALRSAANAAPLARTTTTTPKNASSTTPATTTATTATMTNARASTSVAATNTTRGHVKTAESQTFAAGAGAPASTSIGAGAPLGRGTRMLYGGLARAPAVSASSSGRRVTTAQHLVGHVVVLGFPARPSHLECFLRPLTGWTGDVGVAGGREAGSGRVPVVLVAPNVDDLEGALDVVERNGYVNTSEVYLLQGTAVSQSHLENAGVRTAKAVLVMKDSSSRRFMEGASGDALRDAEALVSFIKMEDGLLTPDQHVVVELENSSNVRFLHTRTDTRSLHAIAGLGGAGNGGAADEAHYLWPKYAAGMTYNSTFVDSLFGQAFYRPSRIALISSLLLLDRGDQQGQSGMAASSAAQMNVPASTAASAAAAPTAAEADDASFLDRKCCLRQMNVPSSFVGHSFGEMFQHLAAPPLRCIAFALLRARGTRSAPEPYVYTGPRADTVLHHGDRVFVLGKPPLL